jgi:uncharacterized protein YbjT (DUF2867 family)
MYALVTGASGFVGGRLARRLRQQGERVRCLVRNPEGPSARALVQEGFEIHVGDVLRPDTLAGAGDGIDVAYYLVHSMGRGHDGTDFAEQERRAAEGFARMAMREGIARVVYLGGLGDRPGSKHLRSRHETARQLEAHGPPLTYFRAGMIVGSESESYRTLRYLVQRLPAMIAPAWLSTNTQPIGIDDVLSYLTQAPQVEASAGSELQIGGADVLTYGQMLDAMAIALGKKPRPKIPVPFITPWLSSLWIGLVTPVDVDIARALIEGLSTETVVTDDSASQLFDIEPAPFKVTLRQALAEDRESR